MFENAQPQLEKILALVNLCPDKLQEKCFDILLNAYVSSLTVKPQQQQQKLPAPSADTKEAGAQKEVGGQVPDAIKSRLVSTASRLKVAPDKIAALFDFNTDPFSYHAFAVQGTSKAEKTKNIALLLAAKSYLSGAGWTADWKEFRANCADQNCYDTANTPSTMKNAWFRTGSASEGIALSSAGISAAESLLAKMAGGGTEPA